MSKPDPPTPPNPYQTAAAQTGTNVSTGVANAFLNNVNQITPEGSLNYDVTGNYSGPTINRPDLQHPQVYLDADAVPARTGAEGAERRHQDEPGDDGQRAVAPRFPGCCRRRSSPAAARRRAGSAGGIMGVGQASTSFDPGWDITKSYGPEDNFGADRQRVEDA